jgi:hypothetical protein
MKPLPLMTAAEFDRLLADPTPTPLPKSRRSELADALSGQKRVTVRLTPSEFALLLTLVPPVRAEQLREFAAEQEE